MTLSRHSVILIGFTILIMGSVLFLPRNPHAEYRNPSDVIWMERVRQDILEQIAPIRGQINLVEGHPPGILVQESVTDLPAIVTMPRPDRTFVVEIIDAAYENVVETSEWVRIEPETALPAPMHATRLFELKDHLWDLTLEYLDRIRSVYARDREVLSSEITSIEFQIETFTQLLQMEIERLELEETN